MSENLLKESQKKKWFDLFGAKSDMNRETVENFKKNVWGKKRKKRKKKR